MKTLSSQQLSMLIASLAVIVCAIIWYVGHFNWVSRQDEHRERCKRSYYELARQINAARSMAVCQYLEEQIDDFYNEYINLVDFDTVRGWTSELYAMLRNAQIEFQCLSVQ
jgi:hypothetical protein